MMSIGCVWETLGLTVPNTLLVTADEVIELPWALRTGMD
jgi:hypothetical protein